MNPDGQEFKKLLLVRFSLIFIVAVIFFLWLANLRGVFESQKISNDITWQKIGSDLNKSFSDVENTFSATASSSDTSFVKDLLDKASSTAISSISTTTAAAQLKQELFNLTKIATSTAATSSPKIINCPPYINCMPSIGAPRPCVVPVGCEKITQIAY
ncbi:MAG: hypothetical protein WCK59_04700 [Candidatus Falkowbacteria bacterium]